MNVRPSLFASLILVLAATAAAQAPATTAGHAAAANAATAVPAASAKAAPKPAATAPSAKPAMIEVPTGTKIPLVLENAISTRTARPGDPVYFETLYPILTGGRIVIPAGSYMSGEILKAKKPGRIKGRGLLMLKLTQLILPNGYTVNLAGTPRDAGTGGGETMNHEGELKGPTSRAQDAGEIIRSTVYGTAIGAAAGGSLTGARTGMGIGAVAGLLGVLLTRGPNAQMPRGTTLDVVLDHPVELLASRVHFTSPGKAPDLAGPPNRQARRRAVPF